MEKEFDVTEEYRKDRDVTDENKHLWIGIATMTVAAMLDWELFQWIFRVITASHHA